MKIIQKIKAFFNFNGERKEMELASAEIKEEGVFLHPVDDPKHVIYIQSNSVDIIINPNGMVEEKDITKFVKETNASLPSISETAQENISTSEIINASLHTANYTSHKKRFSVMLYQDEYELLMESIKQNGYKKAEYFLACVNSAKKQSFNSYYKRYTEDHKQRYKTMRDEAKVTSK